MSMPSFDKRFIFAGVGLLVVLLVVLIYLPGLPGEFVFDDSNSFATNRAVALHNLTLQGLAHAALASPTGALARPISMLSFAFDAYFFGITPGPFKLTNIFIHIACGLMLYLVAVELLKACQRDPGSAATTWKIRWLSLAVATIWLVHPLNLTSVLYTVQRETALAGFFTAAGIYTYLVARRRRHPLLLWLGVPALTAAGMLCKENAALLPVYLLVVELTLLRFRGQDGRASRTVHVFFLLFLWLPLLGALIATLLHPWLLFAGYQVRDFTWYQRLWSEARILWDYLYWTVFPNIRQLALFHDDIQPSRGLLDPITTLTSIVGIAGLLGFAFAVRRRFPLLSFGILWFFAGHLLESSIVPLELAYEHRNYLPIFGLLLGVTGTAEAAITDARLTRLKAPVVAVLVAALSVTTAVRASEWQSELTFARSEVAHHPGSPRAQSELGWAYMQYIVATHDRRPIPAMIQAEEASRALDPASVNQDIAVAAMFVDLGDPAAATLYLQRAASDALTAKPSATLEASLQVMIVLSTPANDSLTPMLEQVIVNATQNPRLQFNACSYADIWNTLGMFRYAVREVTGSLNAMSTAARLCPSNALIHANYASILMSYGNIAYARKELDMAKALHDLRMRDNIAELEGMLDKMAKHP